MARDAQGNKVFKDKSIGEDLILYAAGAFYLFIFICAFIGHGLGFIGESGASASIIHKVLALVFLAGGIYLPIKADKSEKGAGLGTFAGMFAAACLALWAAMGFAS
jgi:hypothetical protein